MLAGFFPKISVDKMANQILCEEMNEAGLSLTSSVLTGATLGEMMAVPLLVNTKMSCEHRGDLHDVVL